MRASANRTAPESRSPRLAALLLITVLAHLALLMGAGFLIRVQSRIAAAPSYLGLGLSAATLLLALPLGLRRLRHRESGAWWLVTPAMGLVLVGALRDAWLGSDAEHSLAGIATTAAGASLALCCAALVVALHAGREACSFRIERTVLPLVVGLGGIGFVAIAGLGRAAPLIFALPPALVGATSVALLAGVVVETNEPEVDTTPAAAVLVAWIALTAIALASFAAGAVAMASHLQDGPAVVLAACRRAMLLTWLVSIPLVAASVAGMGLRLAELGVALSATKLDFVGTVGLLFAGFVTERLETHTAFARAATAKVAARAPQARPVRPSAGSASAAPPPAAPPSSTPSALGSVAPESPPALVERASVRVGTPVIKGRVDNNEIVARLERGVDRWQNCYDQVPPPRPAVRATLFFSLDEDGSVTKAELRDSNADPKFEKCVILQLYRSGFSNPRGESATVTLPIEFIPDE